MTEATKQQGGSKTYGHENNKWRLYKGPAYSPYAGSEKTVSVITVKGGIYCRPNEKKRERVYIPCYIHAARGSNPEYDTKQQKGRVVLSNYDLDDWDYTAGDRVVIIGGYSTGESREIGFMEQSTLTTILLNEEGKYDSPRTEAVDYLIGEGYELDPIEEESTTTTTTDDTTEIPSVEDKASDDLTDAGKLQKWVETGGDIVDLDHKEIFSLSCRMLKVYGWDKSVLWFEEAYGEEADRKVIYDELGDISGKYEDLPGPSDADNLSAVGW